MTVLNRRPGIASATVLGVMSLAITLVQLAAPQWSRDVGLDVWNYSDILDDERATAVRRGDLEANHVRLIEQMEAADHVADLVIERRLTLAEAADRIAAINEDRTTFLPGLRGAYPDITTDRELLAFYVVLKVNERLKEYPARRAEVGNWLDGEYRRLAAN